MKKLLIGLGVVVLLLVAAGITLAVMFPKDRVVAIALERAKAATGRDVQVKGPISLGYYPTLQIEAKDVSFANAPGSSGDMATAKSMQIGLETWPLVTSLPVVSSLFSGGEIRVTSFVLTDPVISLEVDKQGRKNWSFAKAAGKPAPGGATAPSPAAARNSRIEDVHLGDVRLINGTISYADARTGRKQIVTDIDATVTLPDLDSPAAVKGNLTWNGKKVDVSINAGAGRALLSGERTDLGLTVATDVIKAAFAGKGALDETPDLAGTLDLDVPSIRNLASWVGAPIAFDRPNTFGALKVAGKITGSPTRGTLTDATIDVDAFKARGDLNVDLDAGRPTFKGRLDVDRLDVNPYLLAPADRPGAGANAGGGAGSGARNAGWNTEPINFTPLRALEAELALTTNALQYRKISAGKTALNLKMQGGRLTADLQQMALYDGTASGRFSVDGSGEVAAGGLLLKMSGVQADPLLRNAIGFERLGGRITGDLDVTTRGRNQKEMIEALAGRGSLHFADGTIKGIDLLSMVRNVSSAFLDGGTGGAQRTDFSVLTGTFTINRGVMTNNDLFVQSRVIEVKGGGTIDLPRQTLHYRVEPELAKLDGVTVPVVIDGPWSNIGYRPDLTALLRDPGRALDAVRNLGRDGGGIGGLLGGGRSNDQGGNSGGGLPTQLRNLFGR